MRSFLQIILFALPTGQAAFPDPCASNPCAANVSCKPALEKERGFECGNCPLGFKGDGILCEDINEVYFDKSILATFPYSSGCISILYISP